MAETSSASIEQTYSVILITYNIKYNLLVCPSVRLYPINAKTTEPIRQKFCVGPHMNPGKVCGIWMLKITNFVSNNFDCRKNFGNSAKKSTKMLLLIYADILSKNYKLK